MNAQKVNELLLEHMRLREEVWQLQNKQIESTASVMMSEFGYLRVAEFMYFQRLKEK